MTIKPVADLYLIKYEDGRLYKCTCDAEEAVDAIGFGFEVEEFVSLDNHRAAMLQGAEPVTTAYKLPANTPCKEAPEYIWLQTAGVWPENGEFSELTWCSDNQHQDDTLYVRADVVTGNSPVIPDGWLACSERMPKKNDKVLIFIDFNSENAPPSIHDAEFTGATFRRGGATVNVFPLDDGYGVTHWQPLPSRPAK